MTTIEIQGTLHANGTLALDEKPNLPPGRVKVTLQVASLAGNGADLVAVLEQIHAAQVARGHVPRSVAEIDTDIAESRRQDEEYDLEYDRIREGSRPRGSSAVEGGSQSEFGMDQANGLHEGCKIPPNREVPENADASQASQEDRGPRHARIDAKKTSSNLLRCSAACSRTRALLTLPEYANTTP